MMKFTKDDARKDLSAQMTANGEKLNLSERSLNEQLDTLIPLLANDETELSDFVAKVLPIFKTADANVRNDVSAGIKDYEAKNPVKPNENGGKGADEKTKEENALEKRLAELEAKLANSEREARATVKRNEIISKLKEKGVKDEEWATALLSEVSITDELDVDAKVASFVALYNKAHANYDPDATPGGANGGGNSKKEIQDAIKEASAFVAAANLNAK